MTKSTHEFWSKVKERLDFSLLIHNTTFVLSPRQQRMLQAAMLGVPKFQFIFRQLDQGYRFIPIGALVYDKHFLQFLSAGVVYEKNLEEKYRRFIPEFLTQPMTNSQLADKLRSLIDTEHLSAEFAELWTIFSRRDAVIGFIDSLDLFSFADKTIEENDSSLIERYIFALWMRHKGYDGKKNNKTALAKKLANDLVYNTEVLGKHHPRPWYLSNYKALLNLEGEKPRLIKTVTNMTALQIMELAQDGLFTSSDFPEIFPRPRPGKT